MLDEKLLFMDEDELTHREKPEVDHVDYLIEKFYQEITEYSSMLFEWKLEW